MISLKKQSICVLLCCTILINVVMSSTLVYAAESESETEDMGYTLAKEFTMMKYIFTSVFGLAFMNLDEYIENSDKYTDFARELDAKYGKTDEFTLADEDVDKLYNLAKDDISALDGYYLVQPAMSFKEYLYSFDNVVPSYVTYWNTLFSTANYIAFASSLDFPKDPTTSFYTYFPKFEDARIPYFYIEGPYIYFSYTGNDSKSLYNKYYTLSTRTPESRSLPVEYIFNYLGKEPIKVFYSSVDLTRYLTGDSTYYSSSTFNEYNVGNDNSVTINRNNISQNDWNSISNKAYNNINNNISVSGSISSGDKQVIIDNSMDEVLDEIGQISDSILKTNSLLSNIKKTLDSMKKTLESISDKRDSDLTTHTLLTSVITLLQSIKTAVDDIKDNRASDLTTHTLLTSVITLLQAIRSNSDSMLEIFKDFSFSELISAIKGIALGTAIGSAVGSVVDRVISEVLDKINDGEETVETALDGIVSRLTPITSVAKTRFPFSLPWDVVTIFGSLAAVPVTPVFEIPFNIESINFHHSLKIDLKDFKKLSDISRSFFALTFALILIRLTLLMINRGDLDV